MAQKHLHELLREDQEPFQLHNYIADRHCQLGKPPPTHKAITASSLQPKKLRKPIIETCFHSFYNSPDVKKSPFPSPAKSPCKGPTSTVFLHVPAKTAAMLVEAAMKIQKQSSKPKTHVKTIGFGLFGNMLKKLRDKNKSKKRDICVNAASVTVPNDLLVTNGKSKRKQGKLEEIVEEISLNDENSGYNYEMRFSVSCNNSRLSSAGWSESNEDKSLDMETSCSTSRSDYTDEIDLTTCDEKHFSLSPFRFALQRSPSPGHRTPDLLSPAMSPSRHNAEEISDDQVAENLQKIQQEEEKDQCSPVSVLDPPFEDDDDERDCGDEEDEDEDDDYDIESSYAIVQRAKVQLLHKLRRFERLAELDPVELEKRMLEEDDDEDLDEEEECNKEDHSRKFRMEENVDVFIRHVLSKSNLRNPNKIPADLKRLVLDLIIQEKKNGLESSNEEMVNMVCKKLGSWKEVESNTIDMMIELDINREVEGWKSYQEEVTERTKEIELAIFGLLMEEFSEELVSSYDV